MGEKTTSTLSHLFPDSLSYFSSKTNGKIIIKIIILFTIHLVIDFRNIDKLCEKKCEKW